jgi:hypothetical protein
VLRIDETSKTLAPQAGGLVNEGSPDREEMLALMGASWEAFAHEIGMPSLRFLATEPLPGIDMLAFDAQAGRAVVVMVTGETVEWQMVRALQSAAALAAMDASQLAAVDEALEATVPGDSPQIVMVAGGYDPRALATVEWLTRRHGVEMSCFVVSMLRFGSERLMSVRREPRDGVAPDPASEVQWMLTGGADAPAVAPEVPASAAGLASTPPPGI